MASPICSRLSPLIRKKPILPVTFTASGLTNSTTSLPVSTFPSISSSSLPFTSSTYHPSSSSSVRHFSSAIVQHRDVPGNTRRDTFEFTDVNKKRIERVLKKYPSNYKQSAVIELLTLAQDQNNNWLTLACMNRVAEILDLPPIRVYEVATFYSQFNREKVGKFHLQICGTTPCQLCGKDDIINAVTEHIGIKLGETSSDGLFTMTEVECLAACANAPMMQVNNKEYYENLTPDTMKRILDDFKAGKKVKVGPQNGQFTCEGPMGRTTLKQEVDIKSTYRDLDKAFQEAKEAVEKAKREQEEKKKQAAKS